MGVVFGYSMRDPVQGAGEFLAQFVLEKPVAYGLIAHLDGQLPGRFDLLWVAFAGFESVESGGGAFSEAFGGAFIEVVKLGVGMGVPEGFGVGEAVEVLMDESGDFTTHITPEHMGRILGTGGKTKHAFRVFEPYLASGIPEIPGFFDAIGAFSQGSQAIGGNISAEFAMNAVFRDLAGNVVEGLNVAFQRGGFSGFGA